MSKTKKQNNQPSKSKYQELNDFELEIVCGGGFLPVQNQGGHLIDRDVEDDPK